MWRLSSGPLFEDAELPPPEVIRGCLESVIIAHERLEALLEPLPVGSLRGHGLLLAQVGLSAGALSKQLARQHCELAEHNRRIS